MTEAIDLKPGQKSLGQHWLTDSSSLEAICNLALLSAGDQVLEIGPGLGHLTSHLLARGAKVTAVEADPDLIAPLRQQFIDQPLTVIHDDILKFDFGRLPENYKVVANIPYYLTSHLVRIMLEQGHRPSLVVLLVQKEVAARLAAKPGQMSLLAVSAQFYADISLGEVVSAKLFSPPPKIDSQVIKLTSLPANRFDAEPKAFFRLVKAGFSGKRKTLLNSLSAGLRLSKPAIKQLLEQAKIDPIRRAQTLSLNDWYRLYLATKRLD